MVAGASQVSRAADPAAWAMVPSSTPALGDHRACGTLGPRSSSAAWAMLPPLPGWLMGVLGGGERLGWPGAGPEAGTRDGVAGRCCSPNVSH